MLFEKFEGAGARATVSEIEISKSVPRLYRTFFKPFRKIIIGFAIASGVTAVAEILIFYYISKAIGELGAGDRAAFEYLRYLTILIAILFVRLLAGTTNDLFMYQSISASLTDFVRSALHTVLSERSIGFFRSRHSGALAANVVQVGLVLRNSLLDFVRTFWTTLVSIISVCVLLAAVTPVFVLPIAVWAVACGVIIWKWVPSLNRGASSISQARSEMSARLVDTYSNILALKVFDASGRNDGLVSEAIGQNTQATSSQMRTVTLISFLIATTNCLLVGTNISVALLWWRSGIIDLSEFALISTLTVSLYNISYNVMWKTNALLDSYGTIAGALQGLAPDREEPTKFQNPVPLNVMRGAVQVSDISFAYAEKNAVLRDVSFTIPAGAKVGLVGASGTGKSTLLNLLLGIYQPGAGTITFDETDITSYSTKEVLSSVSAVTQETALLNCSIAENLLIADRSASEDDLWKALSLAKASDFVRGLSDAAGNQGLHVNVGERGASLSGGQRQRICLARALLKPAPILILDEATSALDASTELEVMSNVARTQARTTIVVAHRFSALRNMDMIIVLKEGRVEAVGTHEELLSSSRHYADLWAAQNLADAA
ncbi:ABC transporter ATP-binding protein [Ensifer sp. IC4062]|nr:ABC transporter ATP-binding protein [Ensifer sp. IC4062]MCA1441948.1 ABC transporter ATP-binding protein [Ensifer sp. IC4062]